MSTVFPGAHHRQACISDPPSAYTAMQGVDEEDASQALVAIDSLGGRHMHLYLHKRPGYEAEDVLGGDGMDGLGGASPEWQALWIGMLC